MEGKFWDRLYQNYDHHRQRPLCQRRVGLWVAFAGGNTRTIESCDGAGGRTRARRASSCAFFENQLSGSRGGSMLGGYIFSRRAFPLASRTSRCRKLLRLIASTAKELEMRRAFTLVELLVVIAIIGILVGAIAAGHSGGARSRAAHAMCKSSEEYRCCTAEPRRLPARCSPPAAPSTCKQDSASNRISTAADR